MRQSRKMSLLESIMNIVIGFTINWVANMIILPVCGVPVKPMQAFNIGIFFTFISLARTYLIRRVFNKL